MWGTPTDFPSKKVPEDGSTVTIQKDWKMILNVDTKIIDHLIIYGTLIFDDSVKSLVLNARVIEIMPGGVLQIGKWNQEYSNFAKIILHGSPSDSKVSIGPQLGETNKAIINKVRLDIYGKSVERIQDLYQSATPNSSTLKLFPKSWKSGDRLVIPSSTTKAHQHELVTIDSVGDKSITIKEKINYFHKRETQIRTNSGTPFVHGRVIKLNRNIFIEGTKEVDWGCVIVNAGFQDPDDPANWIQGKLNLQKAEVRNCGRLSAVLAAVNILSTHLKDNTSGAVSIYYSSIHSSFGHAVDIKNSRSVFLSYTNIFDSVQKAVNIQNSSNLSIKNNDIIGVNPANPGSSEVNYGVYVQSDLALDSAEVNITDNHVSSIGGFGIGYFLPGYSCNNTNQGKIFSNNQAHSCDVGLLGVSTSNLFCVKFGGLIGYKNRHAGFAYLGQNQNVIVDDMHLLDNRRGLLTNIVLQKNIRPSVFVQNTIINGRGFPEVSSLYQEIEECMSEGLILSSFSIGEVNYEDVRQHLPFYKSVSQKNVFGVQYLENVRFENFEHIDCEGIQESVDSYSLVVKNIYNFTSVYVKLIKTHLDYSKKHDIFFDDKEFFGENNHCDQKTCSEGFKNVLIYFFEPPLSFQNDLKHTIFYHDHNTLSDPDCQTSSTTNLVKCSKAMGQVILQTSGLSSPNVFPFQIDVQDASNIKTVISQTVTGDRESVGIVKINHYNKLHFPQDLNQEISLKLETFDKNGLAVIQINLDDSYSLSVYKNDYKVDPQITYNSNLRLDDDLFCFCGNNKTNSLSNELLISLDGSDSCLIRLGFSKALGSSLKIDSSIHYFLNNDGIWKLKHFIRTSLGLQIKSNAVKITKIDGENPIIVHFEIQDFETHLNQEEKLRKFYCLLGEHINLSINFFEFEIIENLGTPTLFLGNGVKSLFYKSCVMNSYDDIVCVEFDTGKSDCKTCKDHYFLDITDSKHKRCMPRSQKRCASYNPNKDECITCARTDYLEQSDLSCRPLTRVSSCEVYEKLSDQCKHCETKKYLKEQKCHFVDKLVKNCLFYDASQICEKCKDGFYTQDGTTCSQGDIEGCLEYESKDVCLECDVFYRLASGNCQHLTGCTFLSPNNPFDCQECEVGKYYLTDSRTCSPRDETLNCREYDPSSNKCSTCQEYHWLDENKNCIAHTKMENCRQYEADKNKCSLCNSESFLYEEGDNTICKPVSKKIQNCFVYSNNQTCDICIEDYIPQNDTCVLGNIPGCKYFNSFVSCSTCYYGYYLEESSSHCIEYSLDLDCKEWNPSKDECLSCHWMQELDDQKKCKNILGCETFIPESNKCEVCDRKFYMKKSTRKCIARKVLDCATFDVFRDECLTFKKLFYLDKNDGNKCKKHKLVDNCQEYHKTQDFCESCLSGFFKKESKCEPVNAPIKNCQTYSDKSHCEKCFDGYYLKAKECHPGDIDNCGVYHSEESCVLCKNGYYYEFEVCHLYSPKMFCKTYNLFRNECLSCYKGYAKDRENKCVQIQNCLLIVEDKGCQVCESGFFLDSESKMCIERKNNTCKSYKPERDQCEACDENMYLQMDSSFICKKRGNLDPNCQAMHPFEDRCFECQSGFVLLGSTCHEKSKEVKNCSYYNRSLCIACDKGFALERNKCVVQNCNEVDALGKCTSCKDGFYLQSVNKDSGKSVKVCVRHTHHPNCAILEKSKDQCKDCSSGYVLNEKKQCEKSIISENCQVASTSDKVEECPFGKLIDDKGNCISDNCQSRDGNGVCLLCRKGFTLDDFDKKCSKRQDTHCLVYSSVEVTCSLCEEKYYLSDDQENSCSKVNKIPNCMEYKEKQNECQRCSNYFFLENGICKKCINGMVVKNVVFFFLFLMILILGVFCFLLLKKNKKYSRLRPEGPHEDQEQQGEENQEQQDKNVQNKNIRPYRRSCDTIDEKICKGQETKAKTSQNDSFIFPKQNQFLDRQKKTFTLDFEIDNVLFVKYYEKGIEYLGKKKNTNLNEGNDEFDINNLNG